MQLIEETFELVSILGKIDRFNRGAEDRNVGILQRLGELQRRLPAKLHDHADQRAVVLLLT